MNIRWSLDAYTECPKCNNIMCVDSELHLGKTVAEYIMEKDFDKIKDVDFECYNCGETTTGATIDCE